MIKLHYSKTSPFARKVIISALKLKVFKQIELIQVDVFNEKDFKKVNPLVKVPALEINKEQFLTNSPFICEYINHISSEKTLYAPVELRWQDLQFQSLADGMMEALVLRRLESLRDKEKQDFKFDLRQKEKVLNVLDYFNLHTHLLKKDWTIGEISLACALGYLQFRFSAENLLSNYENLAPWFSEANENPWFKQTHPL